MQQAQEQYIKQSSQNSGVKLSQTQRPGIPTYDDSIQRRKSINNQQSGLISYINQQRTLESCQVVKEGNLQYSNSNKKKVSQGGNSISRTHLSGSGQRQEGSIQGYQRQSASSQLLQMQLTSTQSKLLQTGSQNLIENLHMWPSGPGSQLSSNPELLQERSIFPEGQFINGINTVDRNQEGINHNFEKKILKFNIEVVNRQQSELMKQLLQIQLKKQGDQEINELKKVEWFQDMNIEKVYQQIELIVAQFLEIEQPVLDMLSLRILDLNQQIVQLNESIDFNQIYKVRVDQNEQLIQNQQNQGIDYMQAHNRINNMTEREQNIRNNNADQQSYRSGNYNQEYPNNQNILISNPSNILIPQSQGRINQNMNYQFDQQSYNQQQNPQHLGNRQSENLSIQEEFKQNSNMATTQSNRNTQNTINQNQSHQNFPAQQNQIIVMPSFGTQVGLQGVNIPQPSNFASMQPVNIIQNKSSSGNTNTMTQKSLPLSPAQSLSYQDQINPITYLNPIINNQIQNYPIPVQQQQYMFFNNINMNNEQFKNPQLNQQFQQPGQNLFHPMFSESNFNIQEQNNQLPGINCNERGRQGMEQVEGNMDCDISQSFHKNRQGNESLTSIISDTLSQQILKPFQFRQQKQQYENHYKTQYRNELNNIQQQRPVNLQQSNKPVTDTSNYYTQRNIEFQNVKRNEMIPTIDLQNIGQPNSINSQSHRQLSNQQTMYPLNSAINHQSFPIIYSSNQNQASQQESDNYFQNLYNKIDQKNHQITQQMNNVQQLVNGQKNFEKNDDKVNMIILEAKEDKQFVVSNEINKDLQLIQSQQESPQISTGQNEVRNKQVSTPNQNQKSRRFSQYKIQNAQKIQSPLPLYNKAHSYIQKQKILEQNQISEKQDQIIYKNQLSKVDEEYILHQSKDTIQSRKSSQRVQESLIEHVKLNGFKKGFQEQDQKQNQLNVNQTKPNSQKNEMNMSSQNSASYQSLLKEKSQIRNMRSQEFIDGNDQQQYRNYKMLANSKNSASSNLFMYSDTKSVMPLQQSHPFGGSIEQKQINSNDAATKGTNEQYLDDKLLQNQQQKYLLKTPTIENRSRNSSKKRIQVKRSKEIDLNQKAKNDDVSSEISQSLTFIDFENKEQYQNVKNSKNQNAQNDQKQNINNKSLTIILEKLGLKLGLDTGIILNRLINKSSDVQNSQKYFELKQQQPNEKYQHTNQQQILQLVNQKMEQIQQLKSKLQEQQEELFSQVDNLQNFKIYSEYQFLKNEEFEFVPENQNILYQSSNQRQIQSSNQRQASLSNQRQVQLSNQRKNSKKHKKKKQMKTPKLQTEMNSFEKDQKTEKFERMKSSLVIAQDPLDKNENEIIENSKDKSSQSSSFSMTMTQDYAMTHNDNHNVSTHQPQINLAIVNQNMNLVAPLSPKQNPYTPIQQKKNRNVQSFQSQILQQPKYNKETLNFETKSMISESNLKTPNVKSRSNNKRQILNNGKLKVIKKVSENAITQNDLLQNYNEVDLKTVMNDKQVELSEKSRYIANRKFENTYSDISQLSYIGYNKKEKFDDQKTVLNQSLEELSEKSRYIANKKHEQTYSDISQISYIGYKKHQKFDDQKTLINQKDDCISTVSALIPNAPGREFEKESNYSQISRFGTQKSTFRNVQNRNEQMIDFSDVKTVQGNYKKAYNDNESQSSIPAPQRMLEKTYSDISCISKNYDQFQIDQKQDQTNKFQIKQNIIFQSQAVKDPLFQLKEKIKGVSNGECDSPYFQLKTQASLVNIKSQNSINIASVKESNQKQNEHVPSNEFHKQDGKQQQNINLADFQNTVEAEQLLQQLNQINSVQMNENQYYASQPQQKEIQFEKLDSNELQSSKEFNQTQQINKLSIEKNSNNKNSIQQNQEISNLSQKSISSKETSEKQIRNQWNNKVHNSYSSNFGAAFYLKNPSRELEKLDISEQENEESNSDEEQKEKLKMENYKIQSIVHITDVQPLTPSDDQTQIQNQGNLFKQNQQSQDANDDLNNNQVSQKDNVNTNIKPNEIGRNFSIQNLLNFV